MENIAPGWFDEKKIVKTFDARDMLASGGHPVAQVLADVATIGTGNIYLLITPFLPAPLIDKVKDMGFDAWTKKENDSLFRNYFCKA